MSQGWIKLHRQIQYNDLWIEEPFTRGQAWVDLILLANHKDGLIYVRGNKIKVKRGQVAWSQKRLSERWQWSRGKVSRFLNDLEEEGQIGQQKNFVTSLITITKYSEYQKTDSKRTADRAADGQQIEQQTDTNKNDKNGKNGKNGRFTPPQLTEVQEYMKEKNGTASDAERFIDFYESKGWYVGKNKMKDWRAAVRNWISRNKTTTDIPAGFPR